MHWNGKIWSWVALVRDLGDTPAIIPGQRSVERQGR